MSIHCFPGSDSGMMTGRPSSTQALLAVSTGKLREAASAMQERSPSDERRLWWCRLRVWWRLHTGETDGRMSVSSRDCAACSTR